MRTWKLVEKESKRLMITVCFQKKKKNEPIKVCKNRIQEETVKK